MFDVSDEYARARPVAPPARTAAFQVRGRFLTVLTLRIDSGIADDRFHAQLEEQLGRTPQFFSGAPVVLDLAQAPETADPDRIRTPLARRDDGRLAPACLTIIYIYICM